MIGQYFDVNATLAETKVRDFFVYALIPGLSEKFAIIGLQEKRRFLNGKLAMIFTEVCYAVFVRFLE